MKECSHKFVGSNVCLKCGMSIDAVNAQALESLGAVMSAARKSGIEVRLAKPVIVLNHQELHSALDLLLAQFLLEHPKRYPSRISVMELIEWSAARLR